MAILNFFTFYILLPLYLTNFIDHSSYLKSASSILKLSKEFIDNYDHDNQQYPVVTMSYAQTLDGSIAPENRTRLNLSSNISFHLLHSLRARNDAVLIGINTLIADRPQLNIRDQLSGCEIALARTRPIVVDSNLKFLQTSTSQLRISKPIICCCLDPYHPRFMLAQSKIAEIGGSIISCKPDVNGRVDLKDAFSQLKKYCAIKSILVEGGAEIIQTVLDQNLCHQIVLTLKPSYYGGYRVLQRQLNEPLTITNITLVQVEDDFIMYGHIKYDSKN